MSPSAVSGSLVPHRRGAEVDIAGLVLKDFPGDVLGKAAEQAVVIGQLITIVLDDFRLEENIDLRGTEMIRNDHDVLNDGIVTEKGLVDRGEVIGSGDILFIENFDAQGHVAVFLRRGQKAVQCGELLMAANLNIESKIHLMAFRLIDFADGDLRVLPEQRLDLLLVFIPGSDDSRVRSGIGILDVSHVVYLPERAQAFHVLMISSRRSS